jgi:phosphate:Na+ symporter
MWGHFILGFGLLFTGLGFIKDAFSPFQDSEALKNFLLNFGAFPILGILFGVFMTVLLQSSSATIALLQIMALSGLIDFRTAVPVILGDNIGTTITAQLAAIGGNTAAKRTAMAHTLLNTIGVLYMFIPVYTGIYATLIERIVPGPVTPNNIMLHIALSHSLFNIVNSFIIFLPLIGALEKLTVRLTRIKPGTMDMGPMYLEKHLLNTPTLALEGAKKEINRMVECARDGLQKAMKAFFENDKSSASKVEKCEELVDNLQKEITGYLVDLAERELDEDEAGTIPVLLHCVNDLERVGDHAVNIGEIAQRKIEQKLPLKGKEIEDLQRLVKIINSMFENTEQALSSNDIEFARAVLKKEKKLNYLQVELKEVHMQKVQKGKYNYLSSIIYNDFVDNMEKIGDHLTNIAQGVLRQMRWGIGPEKEEMLKEVR